MTKEPRDEFAAACVAMCPGFVATARPRRGRKSELLAGELAGRPVIAKRLCRPTAVWAWYFAREAAMYRMFAAAPPPVRVPRLIACDRDVLVVERIVGAPVATRRRPRAELAREAVEALLAQVAALARWPAALPAELAAAPAPRARSQLRERLLEDPTAPREWIREGLLRCGRRGWLAERVARRCVDALADADADVAFGHGDLLLRNVIADARGELVVVDWECAGLHVRDWDLALLSTQLAAPARELIEAVTCADDCRRRAFHALVVFARARELRFLRAFGARARDAEVRRCRAELAAAIARIASD